MNCLEFRRQLSIDPQAGGEFAQHRAECARCAEAFVRARSVSRNRCAARSTFRCRRISPNRSCSRRRPRNSIARRRLPHRTAWFSTAAAAVLAIGIGVYVQAKPLPEAAVDHLKKEAFILGKTQPIADEPIRKAFAEFGVTIDTIPARIEFRGVLSGRQIRVGASDRAGKRRSGDGAVSRRRSARTPRRISSAKAGTAAACRWRTARSCFSATTRRISTNSKVRGRPRCESATFKA